MRIRDLSSDVCSSDLLVQLYDGVLELIEHWRPAEAAVEETFVNRNPESTLKLGLARGVVLLAPAKAGLPVAEYAPKRVKKSVVGTGSAAKEQVQAMIAMLLPGARIAGADAAAALAVAVCHAHTVQARGPSGHEAGRSAERRGGKGGV